MKPDRISVIDSIATISMICGYCELLTSRLALAIRMEQYHIDLRLTRFYGFGYETEAQRIKTNISERTLGPNPGDKPLRYFGSAINVSMGLRREPCILHTTLTFSLNYL